MLRERWRCLARRSRSERPQIAEAARCADAVPLPDFDAWTVGDEEDTEAGAGVFAHAPRASLEAAVVVEDGVVTSENLPASVLKQSASGAGDRGRLGTRRGDPRGGSARATLYALERASRPQCRRRLVVVLGNTMAELLAMAARDTALDFMCRRAARTLLRSRRSWSRRHVPSQKNVADLDSRWADRGMCGTPARSRAAGLSKRWLSACAELRARRDSRVRSQLLG